MARIERVNYDSYIKPLEHIQKAHNDTLADMANMSQQSEILDYYLDPELDKGSYNLYNNFKNEFNAQATDFAQNGYTRNNGARLLNLHRNYNRNVGNVLDAVKNREAERAEQHKLFADSNGQVVFGNGQNADEKSVDDYLRGNKGYVFQNLDEVYKYAKNQAAAASKREYKDGIADAVRVLDNNYYKILEETGYNTQAAYEKLDAMMADVANQLDLTYNPNNDPNIDPKDDPAGLIRNMREELRRRGLENYSNEDKHKIISSFLTGTYEGLGYEPKLTMKETDKLKSAGAARSYSNYGGPQYPDSPYKPQSDKFTIQSSIDFNVKDVNDAINWFLKPDSKKLGNNDGWRAMFVKNPDGNDGSYHLAKESEYNAQLKPLDKNAYNYEKLKKKRKEVYDNNIAFLKKYMQMDEIPDSYYKYGTNVAAELANYRDAMVNYKKATEFDFPSLQYNGTDTPEIVRGMLNLSSDTQIWDGIKYNAKTGQFSSKNAADKSEIRTAVDNAKPGDIKMWLAPTPLNGNYFHIVLKLPVGDKYKTYFIPLKNAAHFSDAQVIEQLYQAYEANKNVIQALNEKYPNHKITDPKDVNRFKEANIFMKEFYKQHLLETIKSTKHDVKDYQVDINVGPEWTDINGHKLTTNKRTGQTTVEQ